GFKASGRPASDLLLDDLHLLVRDQSGQSRRELRERRQASDRAHASLSSRETYQPYPRDARYVVARMARGPQDVGAARSDDGGPSDQAARSRLARRRARGGGG